MGTLEEQEEQNAHEIPLELQDMYDDRTEEDQVVEDCLNVIDNLQDRIELLQSCMVFELYQSTTLTKLQEALKQISFEAEVFFNRERKEAIDEMYIDVME